MADVQQLLNKTSRTFSLAIPLLPEPARTDVALAYLVFRIVDTLEDAENLEPQDRVRALDEAASMLRSPRRSRTYSFAATWSGRGPTLNCWYQELLANTPHIMDRLSRREPSIQRLIRHAAHRTAKGMASFLKHGRVDFGSYADLKRYCYYVAGIVGEMLTSIFAAHLRTFSTTGEILASARAFGEGLQLVNILKDIDEDARCERLFIPANMRRAAIFEFAREDLRIAQLFVERLRDANAPHGYLAFAQLPLWLAWATLDRVQRYGAGAKVPRDQVDEILRTVANPSCGLSRLTLPAQRERCASKSVSTKATVSRCD